MLTENLSYLLLVAVAQFDGGGEPVSIAGYETQNLSVLPDGTVSFVSDGEAFTYPQGHILRVDYLPRSMIQRGQKSGGLPLFRQP